MTLSYAARAHRDFAEIEAVEINDPMAFDGGGGTVTAARIFFRP
jgi:hypothetical protein